MEAILSFFDFEIEFIKGENNPFPDFLTRKFLEEIDDKITYYTDFTKSKKGKGKRIQKDDDYQIIPIKNTFLPLIDFPLFSYKTSVTNSLTKNSCDNYFARYTEQLFLTSYKIAPTNLLIWDLVHRNFMALLTFATIHNKPDNFINSFSLIPSLLILLIPQMKPILRTFYIQNLSSKI